MKRYCVDVIYEDGRFEKYCFVKLMEAVSFYYTQAEWAQFLYKPGQDKPWTLIEDNGNR